MHGLLTSWDPSTAAAWFPDTVGVAAWSPCSGSIAISWGGYPPTAEILDAATLVRLTILEFPTGDLGTTTRLIFSPDGRLLTWFGYGAGSKRGKLISWDLQTGVRVSYISTEEGRGHCQITYSACGTMIGILSYSFSDTTIDTYNALSGACISSHLIEGVVSGEIWTHGEHLRFATMALGSITMWEARFASTHTPKEVETLSIPDGFHNPDYFLAHPTLPRLALVREGRVRVWDTQDSRFLLDSVKAIWTRCMSFSPDGRFFACSGVTPEWNNTGIYLWKESHTGYVLHQKLVPDVGAIQSLLSPNGGSVIAFGGLVIQLWHTMDSTTSISAVSAQTSQSSGEDFVLGFSPDEALAAVVRKEDKTIAVLDLKSGIPRLIIDTGMEVYGLGVTGSSIVAADYRKIVTWDLHEGDHIPNPRVNITDSVRTATLDNDRIGRFSSGMSVSPDLHRIVFAGTHNGGFTPTFSYLCLYNVPTGQHLATVIVDRVFLPTPWFWFTPDGREVWCVGDHDEADRWNIVEDRKSDVTELEYLGLTKDRPDGFPRQSSHGYRVMDSWWIISPSGKRLFWLPPKWRPHEWQRMWGRRFLALLQRDLPEAVILELE